MAEQIITKASGTTNMVVDLNLVHSFEVHSPAWLMCRLRRWMDRRYPRWFELTISPRDLGDDEGAE